MKRFALLAALLACSSASCASVGNKMRTTDLPGFVNHGADREHRALEGDEAACTAGDGTACVHVADAYERGSRGAMKDPELASERLRRACTLGVREACARIGAPGEGTLPTSQAAPETQARAGSTEGVSLGAQPLPGFGVAEAKLRTAAWRNAHVDGLSVALRVVHEHSCAASSAVDWAPMSTPQPDALEAAMGRYAVGNEAALGEVYDLAAGPLFAFLLRLSRDRALAEDLTHETFLRIHRARGLYRPGARVMPWAYAIARRLFLDVVRARRREAPSLDAPQPGESERPSDPGVAAADVAADDLVAANDLAAKIEKVLATLPETQATAFRLIKQGEMTIAEAASVLGTTEMTVKLRAHRAYAALRSALGGEYERIASRADDERGAL